MSNDINYVSQTASRNKIASRGSGLKRKFIHHACPEYSVSSHVELPYGENTGEKKASAN